MQFAKVQRHHGSVGVVLVEKGHAFSLDMTRDPAIRTLSDILHSPDPIDTANRIVDTKATSERLEGQTFLAPVDHQEIWAAGVTYLRSRDARMEESVSAKSAYDLVYEADRPEIFFKATPGRVTGPGEEIAIMPPVQGG